MVIEEAVVVQASEAVGDGLLFQAVEEVGVLDGGAGLLGESLGQLELGDRELALAARLEERHGPQRDAAEDDGHCKTGEVAFGRFAQAQGRRREPGPAV